MITSNFIKPFFAAFIVLAFCTLSHHASATLAPSARYVTFHDWNVACDNAGDCQAFSLNEDSGLAVTIFRDAGPNGDIKVEMIASLALGLDQFFIDGKKLALTSSSWSVFKQDGYELSLSSSEKSLAFVDSIKNAKRIEFKHSKEEPSYASLRGLSAALLLIDEVQGRLGTQHAFIRKGNKSETSVPAPRPLPIIKAAKFDDSAMKSLDIEKTAGVVRKKYAELLTKESCSSFEDDNGVNFDDASRLSAKEIIVFLECNRGAYQSYFLAFRAPINAPNQAKLINLPMLPGEKLEYQIGNAGYESKTARLSSFGKGRGFFDCGETADWIFDGKNFLLANHSRLTTCSGLTSPGVFPVLWRSTVK